jgi:hypothetical protein
VWTPADLTPEQESLFRQLADSEGSPPSVDGRTRQRFWDKVREKFAV